MKSIAAVLPVLAILVFSCQPAEEQKSSADENESPFQNGIAWFGENETANHLAREGLTHMMNIEFPKAFIMFEKAVEVDPTLFAPHVALAMFTSGEVREEHKAMAQKYAEGKNETSQVFPFHAGYPKRFNSERKKSTGMGKMHELSNGPFIHFRYALSRTDTTEALDELAKLETILSENNMNTGHINNIRGYIYHWQGDHEKGLAEIEKYMENYPNGYNPLDSRAEFYLFAGDTVAAIEGYEKVLDKFPYSQSAQNAIKRLSKE